ncbi:MAG: ATPase [Burkholderiales bacterium RIFCSPLOWO2_02_FULL_57_36]|nr:MAG: ATPase [Burkholderiales bacterium RIFCSPLOWO2_02_FULL_57_36]
MQNLSSTPEHILRRLEWTVIRRLDGLLQGDYRTLMRGAGLDLADLREYQHGDDVRHIDWNVTARLQSPYVREYTEDREVAAWFLLDLSASVDFGSSEVRKRAIAADFVALIARLMTRHGNRVGAILYGTGVDEMIPARAGRRHVLHLMQRILTRPEITSEGETRLLDLLLAGANFLGRRSTVFIVSDFISIPGWEQTLGQLARRHEVTAVRLSDPLESDMPDLGMLTLEDAETGEQILIDTHDMQFRSRLSELAAEREAALRQSLAAAGVDTLELSTDDDLLEAVLRFTDLRKRRARSAGGSLAPHLHSVSMVSA